MEACVHPKKAIREHRLVSYYFLFPKRKDFIFLLDFKGRRNSTSEGGILKFLFKKRKRIKKPQTQKPTVFVFSK